MSGLFIVNMKLVDYMKIMTAQLRSINEYEHNVNNDF